jgi:hypothetical protein
MSVASIFTIQTDRLLRGRAARLVSRVGLSPGTMGGDAMVSASRVLHNERNTIS